MISKPGPDQHLSVKTLVEGFIFLGLLMLASSGFGAVTTHHFDVSIPDKVIAGEAVEIKISAMDKDGHVIADAAHKVDVVFASPEETIVKELEILNGVGSLSIQFQKLTFYLVNVKDQVDPTLNRGGSIRVTKGQVQP